MDAKKVGEAPYLLLYLDVFEKSKFVLQFLYSSSGKEKLNGKDKKDLADIDMQAKILTKSQAETFCKFTQNRNKIAHELWKLTVEYKTDYLGLSKILRCLKECFEHNKHLIDKYNNDVNEEEKIYPQQLLDSIKEDTCMLLDENEYPDIFAQLN